MSRRRHSPADFNYWPSVADMILAAFMVMLILWFTENLRAFSLVADARAARREKEPILAENMEFRALIARLHGEEERLKLELADLRALRPLAAEVQRLQVENLRLQMALKQAEEDAKAKEKAEAEAVARRGDNDQPPNIVLADGGQYKFPTGSATLSPQFEAVLTTRIFPDLQKIVQRYRQVDLIEIIGHTDDQPLASQASNLDRVLSGTVSVEALRAGSNADLGLMRAVAVRLVLQRLADHGGLPARVHFRTYSAAQTAPAEDGSPPTPSTAGDEVVSSGRLVPTPGRIGADEARRRIEIRFTRLNPNGPR